MDTYLLEIGDLTYMEALKMSATNYQFDQVPNSLLQMDFRHMSHFEPFAMLVAINVFKRWLESCRKNNIKVEFLNYSHCSYAGHMGFFKSFGFDYGNEPNEARGSMTYLPITVIGVDDLHQSSKERREKVQETIVRKSRHLASILGQGNFELETTLTYAIREIMRNVVEHSQSDTIVLAAQRWPNKGEVEIAILDEGVGIKETLSANPHISIPDTLSALDHALQPGISGKAFYIDGKLQNSSDSEWDNSGFGLYVTSELCKLGGEFTILSNDRALHFKSGFPSSIETNLTGTAVRLKLNLSQIPDLGDTVIKEIVKKGEAIASTSSIRAVTSASKASRLE